MSVPERWAQATIADCTLSMQNGIYRPAEMYSDEGVPCLRMYNILDGAVVWRDIKRMILTSDEVAQYSLVPGDVLVNRVNSRELVGKAAVIPEGLGPCVFESKNIRVRVDARLVSPRYLNYLLLAAGSRYFVHNAQQTVGMASVNQMQLAAFPVPLAARPEQDRIVAEIEKQFTRLDAAVAALKRVQANLKRYRASVLKAAYEGRLVPEVDRLSGDTSSVREKCAVAPMEQVAAAIVDCPHSTPRWTTSGRICVRTTEFTPGLLDLSTVRYVSETDYAARTKRLKPAPADILYSREGGILGVACLVPPGVELCLGQRMMLIRVKQPFTPEWVMHFLNSPASRQWVRRLTGGSASPHVNVADVKQLAVPTPTAAEQHRIVAEVERRLSVVTGLEADVRVSLRRAGSIKAGILGRAFSGRLVPRDPADEPASALLERIKAERAAEARVAPGRPRRAGARRPGAAGSTMSQDRRRRDRH
jgi:type I restriction enzyme S subunit